MAKKKKKKAVKKVSGKSLAPRASTPPATTGKKPRGLEHVERNDILMPRLKLLQPLSPEVTEGGHKAGTIHNNLTGKNYGEKITIRAVLHYRSRIKWTPKDDGGGIDCSAPDAQVPRDKKYSPTCGECKFSEWDETQKVKKDQAPKCTLYDNFIVLVADEKEPVIMPFERTKQKVARKFYSIASLKNADLWEYRYDVSVSKERNANDETYFNYEVVDGGAVGNPALGAEALALYEALVGKTISDENAEQESGKKSAATSTRDDL